MKLDKRFLAWLVSSLAFALPLAAAPGRLTSAGPFGTLDSGVEDLVFPGSDPRQVLVLNGLDLFESRDAGATWRSLVASTPTRIRPASLAIDSTGRWYVTTAPGPDGAIWYTTDAGLTWVGLPVPYPSPGAVRDLHFFVDRFQPANIAFEVHVAGSYHRFVSRDRGANWSELGAAGLDADRFEMLGLNGGSLYLSRQRYELATGLSTTIGFEAVSRLFFDRTRPDTLYPAVDGGPFGTLYSSTSRGASWTPLREYGPAVRYLAQSPKNPSHMALGDSDGLALSLDRGNTWTGGVLPAAQARNAAFDPASGELLLAGNQLVRRHLDGSLGAPASLHGLLASTIVALGTGEEAEGAFAVDLSGRTFRRDRQGIWQRHGELSPDGAAACRGERRVVLLPHLPGYAMVACEGAGLYATNDFGWTWTPSPLPFNASSPGTFDLAAGGSAYFLLGQGGIYRSQDFGSTWQRLFVSIDYDAAFAVHPDPARGVLGVGLTGGISRSTPSSHETNIFWLAGGGVTGGGGVPHSKPYPYMTVAHDAAHPDLVYAIHGSVLSRSQDFGTHWEVMSDLLDSVPAPLSWDEDLPITEALIDPFDADHLLLLDRGLESRDGGRTFVASPDAFGPAAFGREIPGHFLQARAGRGVLERTTGLPACEESGFAWCAGGGRYLLSVAWKDFEGRQGRGGRIPTGSESSGVFYFFHPNNWELLVKVLDGCAINQRQWVFAAGTTDVEFLLRVEDRWTGQIRFYANPAGQASAAITDTAAFAGCYETPPAGAIAEPLPAAGQAGERTLELLAGRFAAETRWTDFAGHQGDGLTTALRSDNSGLFYFFDPNNWEVLVKVLDGCAINHHYWVLAAATTDVGYRLEVRDRQTGASKTYGNPVGRAAPATIDLEAFPCAGSR